MASRRALLIAPLYDGNHFAVLPGAAQIAARCEAALTALGGYDFKTIRGFIKRADLNREVRTLADTSGEVLLYLYGHGVLRDVDSGVFVTSDGEPDDEGVLFSEIIQRVFRSKASEAIVLVDCCHSGAAAPVAEAAIRSVGEEAATAGRVLIAGCAAHQMGWVEQKDQKSLGVFSWHLLKGIEGAGRIAGSPNVRGSTLGSFVQENFRAWNQTPVVVHRETGDRLCVITKGFETRGEVTPPARGSDTAKSIVLGVPFLPSQVFVGRDAEIESLTAMLTGRPQSVAVSATVEGLGGIGKTELVIQLIRSEAVQKAFKTTVWLDAAGPIPPQWQRIGIGLGELNLPQEPDLLVQAVGEALNARGRTLIVLDNATDWASIAGLIPPNSTVLVTTRTRDFGGTRFQHLELGILDDKSASDFLIRLVPRLAGDPGLPRLVERLGGHALAIEIAGGAINALDLSVGSYLDRLGENKATPTQVLKRMQYGKTVDQCLAMTWDSLERDSSRLLWKRASLFAPTSAHRELLKISFVGDEATREEWAYLRRRRSDFTQDDDSVFGPNDAAEFDEAFSELRARNVFSRIEGSRGERWAMHRLVRDYGRERLKSGEFLAHAMAVSEWLRRRRPPLDLAAEVPHLVTLILDSARFGGEFTGLKGSRSLGRETVFAAFSDASLIEDADYLLQFIREEVQDPKAVGLLLEGMVDINEDVRRRSITILERLSHIPEVVNGFMKALDDPDPGVRLTARKAIVQHGGERLLDVLLQTALSEHSRAAIEATRCMAASGEAATPTLVKLLAAGNPSVRFEAAVALGERRESAGRPELLHALNTEPDLSARLRALVAVIQIRDASVDELSLALLGDASPQIQRGAFAVLREAPRDIQIRALNDIFGRSDPEQRAELLFYEATDLAIRLNYSIPLDVIRSMVKNKGSHWWGGSRMRLLAHNKFLEALPILKEIADRHWEKDNAHMALDTLREIGNFAEVKAVLKAIQKTSKDKSIQNRTAQILTEFGKSPTGVKNQSATTPLEALKASAKANPKAAVSQAQGLLSSSDPLLRKDVIRIIGPLHIDDVDVLLEATALTDAEDDVRTFAAAELLRRRCKPNREDKCTTADLIEKEGLLKAEDVVEALHSIGTDSACPRMLTLFAKSVVTGRSSRKLESMDLEAFAKHENAEDRLWAIRGLVRLGKSDGEWLTDLLSDSSDLVRSEAASAHAKLRIVSAIESLKGRLQVEESEAVKKALFDALTSLEPSTP